MKLSRIAVIEPTVKHSFTFKQSTTDLLERYRVAYSKAAGVDVKLKDLVEQMVLDFISEDKSFQKTLRQTPPPVEKAPAVGLAAVPVVSTATSTQGDSPDFQ